MHIFRPTWIKERFTDVTVSFLQEHHITTVFTDLDNTVIGWDEMEASQELVKWLRELQQEHIQVIVVSNNKHTRIQPVAEQLGISFASLSLKPSAKGFNKAMEMAGQPDKEQVLMIGDQILTDVLGSNLYGIRSVFVEPIKESDSWNTKINRFFERIILNYL